MTRHGEARLLNFSRSKSELDLARRRSMSEIVGHRKEVPLEERSDHTSDGFRAMVERVRNRLNLTTLRHRSVPDLIEALELPEDRVCTNCGDGRG